jgi:DNA-binding transcriptional ArsR family regulator
MDVAMPYRTIGEMEFEALRVLAGTTRPLTGRVIARLARNGSASSIQRALRALAAAGVVDVQEAGRSLLYTLNREHVATSPALALLGLRDELQHRMSESIAGWEIQPFHLSLFGSTARGEGGLESDIDVFCVRPAGVGEGDPRWRQQLDTLARQVRRWSGNPLALSEVSEAELRRLRRERPPAVESLRADAITLVGAGASELLRSRR